MLLLKGMLQIPIDLPDTRFNRAKQGANAIREQLEAIIHERIFTLKETTHASSYTTDGAIPSGLVTPMGFGNMLHLTLARVYNPMSLL